MQGTFNQLLPVAIMAHNEERVIEKAIDSILRQNTPAGYTVKVVVVANGCTDRTEEIVRGIAKKKPDKIELMSISEKGKTRAINKAIGFFDQISNTCLITPYVIFLDADCEFIGEEVLIDFVRWFEQNPQLCAVAADCLPDVFFNSRRDTVAEIYRAIYSLRRSLKINSISGMCYGIRFDSLKIIDFPDFQFAEDMYVSSRLNGWFFRDKNIKIVFKTPSDLRSELNRRTRQEISTQRYHKYYSFLKRNGMKTRLFEGSLGKDFEWSGAISNNTLRKWVRLTGIKSKALAITYVLIRIWAKIKASITLKKIRINENLDYWKIVR
jgi:glycosyltransferase involved in cell wall biosynthesis